MLIQREESKREIHTKAVGSRSRIAVGLVHIAKKRPPSCCSAAGCQGDQEEKKVFLSCIFASFVLPWL